MIPRKRSWLTLFALVVVFVAPAFPASAAGTCGSVGTDVNIEIPKRGRGTTTVTFKAEKAGRYTFECSQLCGAGHSFMRATIVVK